MMPRNVWDLLEAGTPVNTTHSSPDKHLAEPALNLPAPAPLKHWRKLPVLR
jgi:hypothetical protein